jgi:hypothetical protein
MIQKLGDKPTWKHQPIIHSIRSHNEEYSCHQKPSRTNLKQAAVLSRSILGTVPITNGLQGAASYGERRKQTTDLSRDAIQRDYQGQGMPLHHTRWTGCRTMPSPMQHNPDITT